MQPLGRFAATLISCIGTQKQDGRKPDPFLPSPSRLACPTPPVIAMASGRQQAHRQGLGSCHCCVGRLPPVCSAAPPNRSQGTVYPPPTGFPAHQPFESISQKGRQPFALEPRPNLLNTPASLGAMRALNFWVAFCDGLHRKTHPLAPPMPPC